MQDVPWEDGKKEGGSLRRDDRSEVKTKHADWRSLLSDGVCLRRSGELFASRALRAVFSCSADAKLDTTRRTRSCSGQGKSCLRNRLDVIDRAFYFDDSLPQGQPRSSQVNTPG
jgi:hypothetical protein